MLRKKIIITSMALSLIVSPSMADLSSFIENNLDSSVISNNAGYYKTQTRGFYTLGDMKVRWGGLGTVHPVHVQAPSWSVGCSGIDMVFGGFSYLNFEYLVQKLKKIASAAPAFAFKMAISTLCKDCDTIMTELEKIADKINSLNFNTCKIAQQIGDVTGEKLGEAANDLLSTGKNDSWIKSLDGAITDGVNTLQSWINSAESFYDNGKEGAKESLFQGSVAKKAAKTYSPIFGNSDEWVELTRGLVGDVYGYIDPNAKKDGTKDPKLIVDIMEPTIDEKKFIDVLLKGGDINVIKCTDNKNNKNGNFYLAPTCNPKAHITIKEGLQPLIKKRIVKIYNKIDNRQELTPEDIKFLNAMPMPIYRIVNVASVIGDTSFDKVAKVIALKEIDALIRKMLFEMTMYLQTYKRQKGLKVLSNKHLETIRKLIKSAIKKRRILSNEIAKISSNFTKEVQLVQYYQNLEKQIKEKSPVWALTSF